MPWADTPGLSAIPGDHAGPQRALMQFGEADDSEQASQADDTGSLDSLSPPTGDCRDNPLNFPSP